MRRPFADIVKALLWPTLATLVTLALLIGLGVWQLERLAWKTGLKQQIAARTQLPPISLAEAVVRRRAGADLEYTRVHAEGRFLTERALYYYAPEPGQPGWHLYQPLELAAGGVLMVNRGFVPDSWKPSTRGDADGPTMSVSRPAPPRSGAAAATGPVTVVGLLRAPEVPGWFTPANDVARNVWYSRDLDGMAAAAFPGERRAVQPFFVEAEAAPAGAPAYPRGGVTRVVLSDRHFEYALTWFGFALSLVGVYILFAYRRVAGLAKPSDGTGNSARG